MKLPIALILQLISLCFAAIAAGQGSAGQGTAWRPTAIPPLDLSEAVAAKVYQGLDGAPVLGVIHFEKGKELEEYEMVVPYTENVTQAFRDPVTGETRTKSVTVQRTRAATMTRLKMVSRRIEVPLELAIVWRLSGERLSLEEVQNALRNTKRCFYVPNATYQPEPFFSEMFKDDVLVVWFNKDKAKEIPEKNSKPD